MGNSDFFEIHAKKWGKKWNSVSNDKFRCDRTIDDFDDADDGDDDDAVVEEDDEDDDDGDLGLLRDFEPVPLREVDCDVEACALNVDVDAVDVDGAFSLERICSNNFDRCKMGKISYER